MKARLPSYIHTYTERLAWVRECSEEREQNAPVHFNVIVSEVIDNRDVGRLGNLEELPGWIGLKRASKVSVLVVL